MQFDGIFWPPLKGIQDGEYKLARTQTALDLLGNPENNIKNIIHIAGTNGKGSTSSFIQSILNANNFTVNLYTSPHLVTVNERIQVHSKNISNEMLLENTKKVYYTLKQSKLENSLTYFEAMTVIAFYTFANMPADFNIFEVGLGGRFDATNVILHPLISVITAISLDHTEYLGNTLVKIATEKCEIIKENSTAIMSFQENTPEQQEIYKTFTQKCKTMNTAFTICKKIITFNNKIDSTFQSQNATTALNAIELIGDKISHVFHKNESINAILATKWRGRMQTVFINEIQREVLIDCAHNIAGIEQFLEFASKNDKNKKKVLIFGMLKRKTTKDIFHIVRQALEQNTIDAIITVSFGEESFSAELLASEISHTNCISALNFMEALNLAKKFDKILLCGSIHLVGTFFEEFNLYNS